ncbi:MAG: hypothetical protein M1115_07630 [Actinobacteria bacterium]|nr:hypothetical protein [Actinomycetota bacterium]
MAQDRLKLPRAGEIAKKRPWNWNTTNNSAIAYGTAVVEDIDRFGAVEGSGWTRRCT